MRSLTKRNQKRNQTEILQLKNTVNEMKNIMEGIKGRVSQSEERVLLLEHRNLEEIIQSENKEKE